jgi:hypothetical protein
MDKLSQRSSFIVLTYGIIYLLSSLLYSLLFLYISVTFFYLTLLGSDILYYDDWDYRQYVTSGELELQ